ncbi:MAG TPA: crossover junction endodeoxyribonuclease RuvC [Terrimicrobiaceae bacterium]|nr:crossover junction endodeoxyribonuclease RuvC [Terrimicrobiaceae bacterium]
MTVETLIAVDPALRNAGYAVLARTGKKVTCREFDVIRNNAKLSPSACLLRIRDTISALIQKHEPQSLAVEGVIFVQSYPTAITLGAARGVVILAAAERGIPVYEYAPRRVKQAVVGRGAADKQQVAFMVRALLGLTANPPADAADAIAIGLTHFQALDAARLRKIPLPAI